MNTLSESGEVTYGVWTAVTLLVSIFVLFIPAGMIAWAGLGTWQLDVIAGLAAMSTLGLLIGVIFFRSRRGSIVISTLASAAFVPALVVCLITWILLTPGSDKTSFGSIGWWFVFSIDVTQIVLSSLRLYQLRRTTEVIPWPH